MGGVLLAPELEGPGESRPNSNSHWGNAIWNYSYGSAPAMRNHDMTVRVTYPGRVSDLEAASALPQRLQVASMESARGSTFNMGEARPRPARPPDTAMAQASFIGRIYLVSSTSFHAHVLYRALVNSDM